jgi:hypothetical protein
VLAIGKNSALVGISSHENESGTKDSALVGILSQQTAAGSGKAAGRCLLFGHSPESQNQGLDQNRA